MKRTGLAVLLMALALSPASVIAVSLGQSCDSQPNSTQAHRGGRCG
jgi:hypothetical protein